MKGLPSLKDYRWIVVNSSGGKDSQTALRRVVTLADIAGVERSRIVVSHQCLGRMEWDGALELVQAQAAHYGLRLEVTRYRDKQRQERSLLDYVKERGKWPSSAQRYCTSEFKRGPGGRALVALAREAAGPILNVYGFRADESSARAKKQVLARNARFSAAGRPVTDWLPIHDWTEAQVWEDIRLSGVRYHWAYDLGMRRFSCVFCIFATREDLLIAGRHNTDLLAEYVAVESATGHRFTEKLSLAEIQAALAPPPSFFSEGVSDQ